MKTNNIASIFWHLHSSLSLCENIGVGNMSFDSPGPSDFPNFRNQVIILSNAVDRKVRRD